MVAAVGVIPVLTPAEMAGVDRKRVRAGRGPDRAGRVRRGRGRPAGCCGGGYGRRVVVVAGRGNNGADGRAAARLLARRGAAVSVLDAADLAGGARFGAADLVIDAAYGTGLSRPYAPPDPGPAPVLAVDIPSGLSGLTGRPVAAPPGDPPAPPPPRWSAAGSVRADRTVTFAAYKPGLLLGDGPERAGAVELADIGLGSLAAEAASIWLVTDAGRGPAVAGPGPAGPQVAERRAGGGRLARHARRALAGRPGRPAGRGRLRPARACPAPLPGAGCRRASRSAYRLPARDWERDAAAGLDRVRALVIGPGLGRAGGWRRRTRASEVARLLAMASGAGRRRRRRSAGPRRPRHAWPRWPGPGRRPLRAHPARRRVRPAGRPVPRRRSASPTCGPWPPAPAPSCFSKARRRWWPSPTGGSCVVNSGSSRLATAGTGDVLSGVIGAFLARGLPALEAAALAAHCHGRAAGLGPAEGLVASDLPDLLSRGCPDVPAG